MPTKMNRKTTKRSRKAARVRIKKAEQQVLRSLWYGPMSRGGADAPGFTALTYIPAPRRIARPGRA